MSVKTEDVVKDEPLDESMSPYMEDMDDVTEDAGDLDFSQGNRPLWLGHLPRSLWESLAQADDNDEIDLGVIRVEGPQDNPKLSARPLYVGTACQVIFHDDRISIRASSSWKVARNYGELLLVVLR